MLLAGYVLGFALILYWMRHRTERARTVTAVAYNYLFIIGMLVAAQMKGQPFTWEGLTETVLKSAYSTPPAMAFRGDINDVAGLQRVAIFCIVSVYTLRAVAVLFFRRALNRLMAWFRVKRNHDVYVLWGSQRDAEKVLSDLSAHVSNPAVVWIPFREEEQEGALQVLPATESYFEKARMGKTNHVLILPDDQGKNGERVKKLDGLRAGKTPFRVTAVLEDSALRLDDLKCEYIDACLTSREDLLFEEAISGARPIQWLKEKGLGREREGVFLPDRPYRLAVMGFNRLSRAFLLSFCENAAFETAQGKGLQARVYGAAEEDWEAFRLDYPALWMYADIEKQAGDAQRMTADSLTDEALRPDCVVIALPTAAQSVEAARRLCRLLNRLGLEDARRPLILAAADGGEEPPALPGVRWVREEKTALTYETLILRAQDAQAMQVHLQYKALNPNIKDWNRLDTFIQSSNRAVVRDEINKRTLASDTGADRQTALWALARYEHRRWVTFYAARGWAPLPQQELTEWEAAHFNLKRPQERRHACMTDWDKLDQLPQEAPGKLKMNDYANVEPLFPEK